MSIETREAPSKAARHARETSAREHLSASPATHESETPTVVGLETLREIRPASKKRQEVVISNAHGEDPWRKGYDWVVIVWFGLMHLGALAAPFFFSWQGLALFVVMQFVTGSFGVCMGYHRLLTHGSFTTYRPVRWLFGLLGGLSGEGSAIMWVATHRKHHAFSDQDEDPHSPRHGGLWAHMNWMTPNLGRKYFDDLHQRYAPDLLKDPGMRFLDKWFLATHLALGGIFAAVGYGIGGGYMAASLVFWGMFVRLVYVLHITWFVNSATHMWGYTNYKTTDDSKNLWWVGVLAFGEGWHNNHHAYQRMAKHGHRWWEFDITYWGIRVLEKTGLAWNVVHDVPGRELHGEVKQAA